jgi:hypothetical protein
MVSLSIVHIRYIGSVRYEYSCMIVVIYMYMVMVYLDGSGTSNPLHTLYHYSTQPYRVV